MNGEGYTYFKLYHEFLVYFSDVLQREDSMNSDAIYVRGICLYYQDSIDKAFQHFQQVLRLAPDHQKAKEVYRVCKDIWWVNHYILICIPFPVRLKINM